MKFIDRNPIFGVLLVAGAFFMENLDGTIIATALPQMAKTFHANPVELNIGMTAYMLTLAVFIPVSGWVADRFGSRNVFTWAIAIFTIASILCGLANGAFEFTAARVLQGLGGAMMVPVGRLVVLRTTEKKDLIRSIAYITWPGLVAPVLGPPVGGFITAYANWRWIFFLNVPLGMVALILSLFWIRNHRDEKRRGFDFATFVLSGVACTSFVYCLELLGREAIAWKEAGAFLVASLVCGTLAILKTKRSKSPLIDLESLKLRTYAVTVFGGSIFRIAISVSPFLLPLLFQLGFGMDAFHSGLYVLALFAGNLGMKTVTTPVLRRFGFRRVLLVNGMLVATVIMLCAFISPSMPKLMIIVLLLANGLTRSMQFTSLATLAFVDVPPNRMSLANSFWSAITQMTMSMGVAVGALALRIAAWMRHQSGGIPQLMDFHLAFVMTSALAALAIFDCIKLPSDAGAVASGHARAVDSKGLQPQRSTA